MGHFSGISRSQAKVYIFKMILELHISTFIQLFSLLEKGRQILMKDNLIDEERAKQEEAAQESTEQKLERLGEIFFIEILCPILQLLFRLQISHWKTCLLGFLD